ARQDLTVEELRHISPRPAPGGRDRPVRSRTGLAMAGLDSGSEIKVVEVDLTKVGAARPAAGLVPHPNNPLHAAEGTLHPLQAEVVDLAGPGFLAHPRAAVDLVQECRE